MTDGRLAAWHRLATKNGIDRAMCERLARNGFPKLAVGLLRAIGEA